MYKTFLQRLHSLFRKVMPYYIGSAHAKSGTKIRKTSTCGLPTDLDNYALSQSRSLIYDCFPKDHFLGEEYFLNDNQLCESLQNQEQYQWTFDMLDSTSNYMAGMHTFGAMISRRRGNEVLLAVNFRPVDEALYGNGFLYAERGKGAWQWCNEHAIFHRLQTAPHGQDRLTVMLEGSSKKFFHPPISTLGQSVTTRPSCSSTIAGAAVATGKASALVTIGNKPWDNWPNILLIEEAGGVVTNWDGSPIDLSSCENIIAAANKTDHQEIVKLLT